MSALFLRIFPTAPWRVTLLGFAVALASLRADPVISEFMASNTVTLPDQDQAFSDWIEIHNPDGVPVNLAGWYLTDSATNKTRWQFPAVTLPAGGYLVVFASNKNRRDPAAELHTNFGLAAEGEYLGLIRPDGVTVASEYAPTYPAQLNDIAYGRLSGAGAATEGVYFPSPTPGATNNPNGAVALASTVRFSRPPGPFSAPFALELTGAGPGQHIRFVAVPPSTAGSLAPEPTATSPRYTAPLPISSGTLIRAAVFSDDLKIRGLSSIAQYFQLGLTGPDSLANFTSRLPVLVIEQHGYGGLDKEDEVRPAWLFGFGAATTGTTFGVPPEFVSPIFMNVRGSSSAVFPKKSYTFDLVNDLRNGTARSLFGSKPFEEWALVGPWRYDPSFIRNSLIYALSNRIGRWAPRTQPVEVFLNANGFPLDQTAYVGVYVLTDKVELHPDRVAIARTPSNATGATEITGGYLLKIDQPDADEYSWKSPRGLDADSLSSVIVASPKADRLSTAQRNYIRGYVQEMEDALLADQASGWRTRTYLDYLDRSSWVDHHILNTFAANPDAFERSAYFHKPQGGKIIAGPVWDMDRAVGSYEDERSYRHDLWQGLGAVEVWNFGWWGILATDPEFMQDWVDRWQTLRQGVFSDATLTGMADQLAADIGPAAAARDAARWVDNVSGFGGTYAGEIAHIKGWLKLRADWIDGQFTAPPQVTASANGLVLDPVAGTQIAYTLDGS
ncbi:MAG: CotH kinase family protein, partial [Opitutaceae bacterium]